MSAGNRSHQNPENILRSIYHKEKPYKSFGRPAPARLHEQKQQCIRDIFAEKVRAQIPQATDKQIDDIMASMRLGPVRITNNYDR